MPKHILQQDQHRALVQLNFSQLIHGQTFILNTDKHKQYNTEAHLFHVLHSEK